MRKLILFLAPLLIIAGFIMVMNAIIAANKKPEEKKRPFNTLAVMADYAKSDSVQLSVNVQGETRPRTEIDLVPQVSGKIVYVSPNFIEGGIFRRGETLLRIEDADYQVAVVRAQSGVAQAEQAVVREKAEGEIARRDFEDLGSGTPSDLALRIPQLAQAEASLSAARAELDAAKLQLTRTSVRAPFDGRVKSKASDSGQFVSPGARLGRIFSADITEVRLALSDNDLSKLNLPVAFVADSRADAPDVKLSATIGGLRQYWSGKLMRTDSTYDTQTRALFAIVEVFDPYGKGKSEGGVPLAPGLFVDAEIAGKSFDNVIVIKRDGLRPENKVYIVDEVGKAEIRDAIVVDTDENRAVISSGVAVGEMIILSPMEKSNITSTFKVLDVNDPKTILVDPPKPDWLLEREKKEDEKIEGERAEFKMGRMDQKAIMDAFSNDYTALIKDMSPADYKAYKKMRPTEKSGYIKAELVKRAGKRRGPPEDLKSAE